MDVPLVIDRAQPHLGTQVCEGLRRAILDGRLRPGTRLPSTRALAARLRLARSTVAVAFDQLTAEGYIEGRRGSGTFVSQAVPARRPAARTPRRSAPPDHGEVRLSRAVSRLRPRAPALAAPADAIDLSALRADARLFPFAVWRRLVRRQLRAFPLRRERSGDGAGDPALRAAIAAYLGRARGVRCEAAQVLVVNGSQQALDLCARVLIDPGDAVAVENPGYPDAAQVFAAAGARVCPVPVDAEGLVVPALPPDVHLAHVTPSHQYPTGVVLSLARRLELLAWARRVRGLVLEDDYDSEFRYEGAPLPALQGLAEAARVVYVGTFSTAMFAGLRLGYLVLPDALVEPFTRAKWYASRHSPHLEQATLADFLRDGHFERHLRRMRRVLRRRREALLEALRRNFGDEAVPLGDAAGLHVVVRFADPRVLARAAGRGVVVQSTRPCYTGAGRDDEALLRFAALDERQLAEGVRRLAGPSRR